MRTTIVVMLIMVKFCDRDIDGFIYLNYLNSGKIRYKQNGIYECYKKIALQLCDAERNKTRKQKKYRSLLKINMIGRKVFVNP